MAYNSMLERGSYTSASATPVPQLTGHPLVRPSTKFVVDFTDPAYQPDGKSIVPGAVGNAVKFKSLVYPDTNGVDTGPDVTSFGTGLVVNSDGSIELPNSRTSGINIGAAGQFNMTTLYKYLTIIWFRLPATGYVTAAYQELFTLTASNANNAQIWIDMGSNGLRPRASIGYGSYSASYGLAADIAAPVLGAPMQLAVYYDPAGSLNFYMNGALVVSGAAPTSLVSAAGASLQISGALKGRVYAAQLHDLGASITAETSMGIPADSIWSASQHVANDYLLGKGALPGWDSVIYA